MEFSVKVILVAFLGVYFQVSNVRAQANGTVFNLTCTELTATASWLRSTLTDYKSGTYTFTNGSFSIRLLDGISDSCGNYSIVGDYVVLTYSFDSCGTVITDDAEQIKQENNATVTIYFDDSIIRREMKYVYTMQCMIDRNKNVSSAIGYNVTDGIRKTVLDADSADYNISFKLTTLSGWDFSAAGNTALEVASFQPIYAEIKEAGSNPNLKFVTQRCYATASAVVDSSASYMFLEERCGLDNSFKRNMDNGVKYQFQVDAFKFIQLKKTVYFHCEVYICKTSVTAGKCQNNVGCGVAKRKRRSIESEEGGVISKMIVSSRFRRATGDESESEPLTSLTRTSPLIKFNPEIKTCKMTTCPSNSKCINLYPAVCRCNEGFVLNTQTKRCENDRVFPVFGIHLDMQFYDAYRDPTSDFAITLATEAENDIMARLAAQDKFQNVDGIKIVGFSPGSVILDVQLIYNVASSPRDAYIALVTAITTAPAPTKTGRFDIQIKKHKIPTLSRAVTDGEKTKPVAIVPIVPIVEKSFNTTILIAIIVPSIVVLFIALLVYKLKMSALSLQSSQNSKEVGFDNRAAEIVVIRENKN